MNLARTVWLAAVAAALACSLPAAAQWAWRDAGGRMVYSDQPPPKSVPAKDVVRRPAASAPAAPPVEAPAEAAMPAASNRPAARTGAAAVSDREIESRRRQQQQEEAEKKTADEEARAAKVAENCERLRAYLRALDGGHRVARVNAAGERQILDDAARAAESERTRAEIEQQCK